MNATLARSALLLTALTFPNVGLAQCPADASSCLICHEGTTPPLSEDGTAWHGDHEFADLCTGCHAGQRDVMDQEGAHQGMHDPREEAVCADCHADADTKLSLYRPLFLTDGPVTSSSEEQAAPAPPGTGAKITDGVLAVLALGLLVPMFALASGGSLAPAGAWRALRTADWPPAVAGAGLGMVVAFSEVVCGRPVAISGGVDRLAAYVGLAWFPDSIYFRFVSPPAFNWQVWLLVGVVGGSFLSAVLSGTARWRWAPEEGWVEQHGPSRLRRLGLAFIGGALVQFGAGIAGGCTSGLAISGGAMLSPAAFVFMAGMFAAGIPTAAFWAWRGRQ